jgi:hypothetical protein
MRDREPSLILSGWVTPVNVSRFGVAGPPTSGHECCGTGHHLRHLDGRRATGDGDGTAPFELMADG